MRERHKYYTRGNTGAEDGAGQACGGGSGEIQDGKYRAHGWLPKAEGGNSPLRQKNPVSLRKKR